MSNIPDAVIFYGYRWPYQSNGSDEVLNLPNNLVSGVIQDQSGYKYGDYATLYVAVKTSLVTTEFDIEVSFDPSTLVTHPSWNELLDKWFEKAGVEKPHESPQWWLMAGYG